MLDHHSINKPRISIRFVPEARHIGPPTVSWHHLLARLHDFVRMKKFAVYHLSQGTRLVSCNRRSNQRIRPPETSGRLRLIANGILVPLSYSVEGGYQGRESLLNYAILPPQPNSSGNDIDVGDIVHYTRRPVLIRCLPLARLYEK